MTQDIVFPSDNTLLHPMLPPATDSNIPFAPTQRLNRRSFPSGFTFGVATSAYQIEGAVYEDGRGLSIWDSFTHMKGHIVDGSTPDIACNSYNMYDDDIKLMVDLGVDAYRFSIAWPRIFSDDIYSLNQKGVAYYNQLINKLLMNGIQPYVTLYHWDLPQVLENDPSVKGWRTRGIVDHYARYAETCFKMFGDRVKNWITFNEPQLFSVHGYGYGIYPPGRSQNCSTEPYTVIHNVLLAHAAAVTIYRKHYQAEQKGRIGITCNASWYEPFTKSTKDSEAAQRFLEFELGWILDPVIKGHYPDSMHTRAGNRLPSFTAKESMELQGSVDFIGINYYTSRYAKCPQDIHNDWNRWYLVDRLAMPTEYNADGELIGELMGPPDAHGWIYNCPWGLPKLIGWITDRYAKDNIKDVPIIITENGSSDRNGDLPMFEALNDHQRIKYMSDTLQYLARSIKYGARRTAEGEQQYNVEGYFAWSLLDNFEWTFGYSCRFGLHYVDFKDKQKRYPKLSASWYRKFLHGESVSYESDEMTAQSFIEQLYCFLKFPSLTSCCM